MKKNIMFILFIVAIVLFMLFCSCSSDFLPFSFAEYRKNEFPYRENYQNIKPLTYSTAKENKPLDVYINMMENQSPVDCKKVMGMNGLFCKPYVADNIIDPMFGIDSSVDCAGSGLTKSKGNICLNQAQNTLLTTRGGNASGHNCYIGNP